MKKRYYLLLPIYASFFVGLGVYEIINPPFSTDSVRIGDYEIKIGTTPAIPEVGKDTAVHLQVLDQYGKELDKFRMGLQIYYNDNLEKSFPPSDHDLGKWDLDYVFEKSGNHIIRVDLFDLKNGGVLSNAFNVTVLNFYGAMFSSLIIAGIAGAIGILIAIAIFQRILKTKNKI